MGNIDIDVSKGITELRRFKLSQFLDADKLARLTGKNSQISLSMQRRFLESLNGIKISCRAWQVVRKKSLRDLRRLYCSLDRCKEKLVSGDRGTHIKIEIVFFIEILKAYLLISYKYPVKPWFIPRIRTDQVEIADDGSIRIVFHEGFELANDFETLDLHDMQPYFDQHIKRLVFIASENGSPDIFNDISFRCSTLYKNYGVSYESLCGSIFMADSSYFSNIF